MIDWQYALNYLTVALLKSSHTYTGTILLAGRNE